jgi:hypothetical protein
MIFYVGFAIPKQCDLCEVENRFELHYLDWLTLKTEKSGIIYLAPLQHNHSIKLRNSNNLHISTHVNEIYSVYRAFGDVRPRRWICVSRHFERTKCLYFRTPDSLILEEEVTIFLRNGRNH